MITQFLNRGDLKKPGFADRNDLQTPKLHLLSVSYSTSLQNENKIPPFSMNHGVLGNRRHPIISYLSDRVRTYGGSVRPDQWLLWQHEQ